MTDKESNHDGVQEAEFRIERSFKFFDQSFNRIKYFSSIANNTDIGSLPHNWSLQNKDGLTYMITAPRDDEERTRLINGYKHFIHCYLVRDSIESFALSLDQFCFMLLLNGKRIKLSKPPFESLEEEEKEFYKKFERAGMSSQEGKVQLLKSALSTVKCPIGGWAGQCGGKDFLRGVESQYFPRSVIEERRNRPVTPLLYFRER